MEILLEQEDQHLVEKGKRPFYHIIIVYKLVISYHYGTAARRKLKQSWMH